MNIDMLIDGILDSYDRYGLINRNHTEDFPNRQNVVSILSDIQTVIFPGFKTAEDIDSVNIRYITGQKVNNIIANLTKEIQKAYLSFKKGSLKKDFNGDDAGWFALDPAFAVKFSLN